MSTIRPAAALLIFLAVIAVYRVAALVLLDLPLFYDEAYYYSWSQELAAGYFSKPPMVAWLIAASTQISSAEWGVRLTSPLCYALAAVFVWRAGLLWFSEAAAAWAGAVLLVLPLVGFNSLFITTDAPMVLCWAAATWALSHAVQTNSWRWWTALGVMAGLGLLSKYSMGLFLFGVLVFGLWARDYRHYFTHPGPYWAAAVAAIVFAPNFFWNVSNDFVSWSHTAEISQVDRARFNFSGLFEFVAAQLICVGPWLLFYCKYLPSGLASDQAFRLDADASTAAALKPDPESAVTLMQSAGTASAATRESNGLKLAISLAAAVFVVIGIQAFISRANANWAAPGFVGIALVIGWGISKAKSRRWAVAGLALNLALMLAFQSYHGVLRVIGVEPSAANDPYDRLLGWREAVQALQPYLKADSNLVLLSNSRLVLAKAHYYLREHPPTFAAWNPGRVVDHHYHLTIDLSEVGGEQFLFVARNPLPDAALQGFVSSELLPPIEITVYPDLVRTLYTYRLQGFRGYAEVADE